MGILRRKKEPKEDKEADYLTESAHIEQAQQFDQYRQSLGSSVYMILDPEVMDLLNPRAQNGKRKPSQFRSLVPAFSHLNRTTHIEKRDAELLMLDYEYIDLIHTLNMNEDEYEQTGWALLESLKIFARNIVADALGGWKGRLVTEQIKIIKTEIAKKKKGGPLG